MRDNRDELFVATAALGCPPGAARRFSGPANISCII